MHKPIGIARILGNQGLTPSNNRATDDCLLLRLAMDFKGLMMIRASEHS